MRNSKEYSTMPNPTQEQTDSTFSPPKHWMALEELDPKYWNNQAEMEVRDQEFRFKPIETLEKLEKADQGGIARREFLTLMGASMAMATLSCARRPVNKIVPYVVKPENVTPGVANWYASSCGICSSGCGTLVKAREGRPIKLEGNPDHPVNQGKLCAKGKRAF